MNETVKLKDPLLEFSKWKEQVASTMQLVMGGRIFTHYFDSNMNVIATGLGEGPFHMELFIFAHIRDELAFNEQKALEDEAERATIAKAKAEKIAAQDAAKVKKPYVRPV